MQKYAPCQRNHWYFYNTSYYRVKNFVYNVGASFSSLCTQKELFVFLEKQGERIAVMISNLFEVRCFMKISEVDLSMQWITLYYSQNWTKRSNDPQWSNWRGQECEPPLWQANVKTGPPHNLHFGFTIILVFSRLLLLVIFRVFSGDLKF